MHVLPCDRVRERLEAFVDAEMPLDEQVNIQSHLHECVSCRLEVSELSEIGHALRVAPATGNEITHETGRITSIILERIRLEQQLSFGVRFRDLFSDMHLVWAGLGATLAMVICIFASAGVLQAASRERPDSLAGLIDYLANPGSNENPVRLDDYMLAPRASFDASMLMPTEDAEFAVAAVVTREGRVQNLEVVAEQARALRVKPEVMLAMLDAAGRARFEPARAAGGATVAVSMVWLLSTTTVKGRPDYDLYLLRPPRWATPSGPSAPAKPRPVAVPVKVAPTGDCAAG
jgi:putative zinc finger protein